MTSSSAPVKPQRTDRRFDDRSFRVGKKTIKGIDAARPQVEILETKPPRYQWQYTATAINPLNPLKLAEDQLMELRIELTCRKEDEDAILILLTNDDSFAFVCESIREILGNGYRIEGIIESPDRYAYLD